MKHLFYHQLRNVDKTATLYYGLMQFTHKDTEGLSNYTLNILPIAYSADEPEKTFEPLSKYKYQYSHMDSEIPIFMVE